MANKFLNDQALKLVQEKESISRRLSELTTANNVIVDTMVMMKDRILDEQREREELSENFKRQLAYYSSVEQRIKLITRISSLALAATIGAILWLMIM